jgi:hypothetical protein
MTIDYEMWIFSDLMRYYNDDWKDEDYDVIWENLFSLYKEFYNGPFNVDSKSVIQCMGEFLTDKFK